MASVGHVAVGMAAARVYHHGRVPRWSSLALWSALSLLPDVDVIGFALGVEYSDPWGHRGATHSLIASAAIGLAVGLAARWLKLSAVRTALIATVLLASHSVLDTMTDGGLGCALFWPFDLTRYFAPWHPIPVAPIGLDFFSPYGGFVSLTELVLFSPVLLFALRSRRVVTRPLGFFLALWLVFVWFVSSRDRIRDSIVGFVLREDTAYSSRFSEEAFRTITDGESDKNVRHLLGAPFREGWFYQPKNQPFTRAMERSAASLPHDECLMVRFENRVVVTTLEIDACQKLGIEPGMSIADVERLRGSPPEMCWEYTWSPGDAHFRLRMVCFLNGRVETVIRRWN